MINSDGGGEAHIGMIMVAKKYAPEDKGVHGFWMNGTACIFDIGMIDSDDAKYPRSLGVAVLEKE